MLGPAVGSPVKAMAGLALVFWVVRRLSRASNPFAHVAFAAFVGQTLVWYPQRAQDYTLMFVIPALFAIAWKDMPDGEAVTNRIRPGLA